MKKLILYTTACWCFICCHKKQKDIAEPYQACSNTASAEVQEHQKLIQRHHQFKQLALQKAAAPMPLSYNDIWFIEQIIENGHTYRSTVHIVSEGVSYEYREKDTPTGCPILDQEITHISYDENYAQELVNRVHQKFQNQLSQNSICTIRIVLMNQKYFSIACPNS